MNVFSFRPHCGESGSPDHLIAAYLTAHSINHGLVLHENQVLQYLFYLNQIGIAVAPQSNTGLHIMYEKNPFPKFFKRGMNVSLSTNDPLNYHMTKDPLLEEYCIAKNGYRLSMVDLCEIAQNSVLQSGFSFEEKQKWLGETYWQGTLESNDISKNKYSNIRWNYRLTLFNEAHDFLQKNSKELSEE